VPLTEAARLHHRVIGKHGSSKVIMQPASEGTGIIAAAHARGVRSDGREQRAAQVHRSTNPYNVVRATLRRLEENELLPRRSRPNGGKSIEEITSWRASSIGRQEKFA